MNTKIVTTVIGLVAVAFVPTVATAAGVCVPLGSMCAGTDTVSSNGSCPQGGQSHSGKDVVMVYSDYFSAYAAGASGHDCSGNSYNFVRVAACTDAGCTMAHWGTGDDDACHTGVFAADGWVATACPIPPPDPGWGSVLP